MVQEPRKFEATSQGNRNAKRDMVRIPLRDGRTLHHDILGVMAQGEFSCGRTSGTGIIAGGPMRAVFEALGVQDVVAKSIETSNPHNMIKATFMALKLIQAPDLLLRNAGERLLILVTAEQAKAS